MVVALNLASVLSILVSFVLPLLVGLVTKSTTPSGVKAVLLLLFSAITGVLSQALAALNDGTTFSWLTATLTAALGFAMAVAMHFGLWKPTGASATAQASLVKG